MALGFLARHNIFADTAENGIEAIEMITKKRYDLVFMDHMMPLMDGVETTRRVRSFGGEYYGIVPIIALSANAVAGTREMFREAGMNDFISKPIESAALNRVLLTWLPAGKKISAVQSEFTREEEGDGWKIFDSRSAIIDVEAAKSRYVSAEEYLGVLRTFAVYTPTLLERIRVPSLGELQDYSITVHGIKGSSYGICADAIGRMAEALEASAKRGDFNAVEAGNAGFISMTERLLAELNAVLSAKSAMTKPRKTSPDETSLAAILKSCEEYDSSGMENALQKLEQFDYGANGEIVDWLRVQIDNIEYEAVKERLISLM
ncbi:MAG: response regulator, partial [Synergistaceae bacterium]|nr:response regulator [Synergistaceae bacterium]